MGDADGDCQVYDPAESYKIVFKSKTDDEAQNWLVEDEPVEGRLFTSEP
jgi:hypothetical protein